MAINAEDLYIRTTAEKDAGANEEDLYIRTTAEKETAVGYTIDLVMGIDIENDIDTILYVAEASISEVGYVTKLSA